MTDTPGSIRICIAETPKERADVAAFILGMALKWHGNAPPPPPDVIFYATSNNAVVGTTGLYFRKVDGLLPIEHLYDFDPAVTPWPCDQASVIHCCRWMSSMPGVSDALLYASALYALRNGFQYGLGEVKERIASRFEELGVRLRFVARAELKIDAIPPAGRAYYLTGPRPRLCMVEFRQMARGLRRVRARMRSGEILLDPCVREMSRHANLHRTLVRAERLYDRILDDYDKTMASLNELVTYPNLSRHLETALAGLAGKRILDVGCGSGALLERLRNRGADVTGIDVSHEAADRTATRGIPAVQGSMHELPFPDGAFAGCVSNFALNYLPPAAQERALGEQYRVLTNGGSLAFTYLHPFTLRMTRYRTEEPHYVSHVDSYFRPTVGVDMRAHGQKFTLFATDWPEILTMVIRAGFRITGIYDAPWPTENISDDDSPASGTGPVTAFDHNPYGILITASKP